ncbi:MAG: class I SAM-dependent methyltransferase [Sphingomonadaceae bacterium]
MQAPALLAALLLLAGCDAVPAGPAPQPAPAAAPAAAPRFPAPDRPVAAIVSDQWSDEESRDNAREAETVFGHLAIRPGLTVADIGAGSGYYTVRLAPAVLPGGRVFANDIMPDYLNRLRRRVSEAGLTNVEFILGDAGDAKLPQASTDIALMVHMYHEIEDPYQLLWRLHDSLKPGGRVAIIDADRPTSRHGTPPSLLRCELAAAGFQQVGFHELELGNYLAIFVAGTRPVPEAIRPCRA